MRHFSEFLSIKLSRTGTLIYARWFLWSLPANWLLVSYGHEQDIKIWFMIVLPINCDIFKYQYWDSHSQTYLWQRFAGNVMTSPEILQEGKNLIKIFRKGKKYFDPRWQYGLCMTPGIHRLSLSVKENHLWIMFETC